MTITTKYFTDMSTNELVFFLDARVKFSTPEQRTNVMELFAELKKQLEHIEGAL